MFFSVVVVVFDAFVVVVAVLFYIIQAGVPISIEELCVSKL